MFLQNLYTHHDESWYQMHNYQNYNNNVQEKKHDTFTNQVSNIQHKFIDSTTGVVNIDRQHLIGYKEYIGPDGYHYFDVHSNPGGNNPQSVCIKDTGGKVHFTDGCGGCNKGQQLVDFAYTCGYSNTMKLIAWKPPHGGLRYYNLNIVLI